MISNSDAVLGGCDTAPKDKHLQVNIKRTNYLKKIHYSVILYIQPVGYILDTLVVWAV